jgi:alpha,alpha-trehalose phosphorylase
MAFVVGLGGMREQGDTLTFTPRLPDGLTRLTFSLLRRGICLRVDVTTSEARYSLPRCEGKLTITHYGEPLTVVGPEAVVRPIAPAFERPPPAQPAGREPRRRSPG